MFEFLSPLDIHLVEKQEVQKQPIQLLREVDGKKYYCIACVFELGDVMSETAAIMSLGIASDVDDAEIPFQDGAEEGFLPDIIRGFVERDKYVPTENTRVVFRLFEELEDEFRQIIFEKTHRVAKLIKKEFN